MAVNSVVISPIEDVGEQPVRLEPREDAIRLENVSQRYSNGTQALDGVSFSVPRGSIFGLLGPNGAGKTSLIRVMCGLLSPSTGRALVFNEPILDGAKSVRKRLCAHLQSTPVGYRTKTEELLKLFGKFYKHPMASGELLSLVGMTEKRDEFVDKLSEGQKQRIMIARAMVGNPELLILDEPTTGLDVAMRHELYALIRRLRDQGRTVVISTHYMEEAEQLCEQVAVLCKGRLFAVESPTTLIRKYSQGEKLEITLTRPIPVELLAAVPGVREVRTGKTDTAYVLVGQQGERMLQHVVVTLLNEDVHLREARVVRPNLEEAYLKLTGGSSPS